ncbi:MAG: ZIP family metal transporter [Clostridiales bacterium]|nr:ZIP family metal transporter [Clostridiales bacterium]
MRWDLFLILMLLPWAATFGGSLMAARITLRTPKKQGGLLGFAAGVMIAASVWSLLLPAFEEAGERVSGALTVTLGFLLGCAGMLALDKLVPHQHLDGEAPEGHSSHLSRPLLLVTAVALHNIPEGIALGVVISAAMLDSGMTWTAAILFGTGLALQNLPEGMAVVLPLRQTGASRKKCIRLGFLASLAEPAAAVLGLLLTAALSGMNAVVMPLLLSAAAGAMIFITVEELIPESQAGNHGHAATYGFLLGFWMMALMGVLGG